MRLPANHEPGRKVTTKQIGDTVLHRREREREREREGKRKKTNDEHFHEELYAVKRLSIKKHFDARDRYYPVVHCA